jgi:hypothetical protein
MKKATNTLALVDTATLIANKDRHRGHLGASQLGIKCARALWYSFRWVIDKDFAPNVLRLFERGQLEEARFVKLLRAIGCEVWEVDPDTDRQWKITFADGHGGGSLDGVGQGLEEMPGGKDTAFLLEFKTHNDASFRKLDEVGVMEAKWEHYVQMQCYMTAMQLPYALYCAVNKNDDKLYFEIVKCNPSVGENAFAKAEEIVSECVPPKRVAELPSNFACKWCDYQRLCHIGDVKVNKNCRTCKHVIPADEGTWFCNAKNRKCGAVDAQLAGCPRWERNPSMEGRYE